ncbi:MAG: hypothetical protein ACLSHC_06310 [Bilophila wadsworthia]
MSAAAAARQPAFRVEGQGVLFSTTSRMSDSGRPFSSLASCFSPITGFWASFSATEAAKPSSSQMRSKTSQMSMSPRNSSSGMISPNVPKRSGVPRLSIHGAGAFFELVDAHGADIGFVGRVGLRFLIGLGVLRQCAQEFGIRFALALLSGRAAVVQGQFGGRSSGSRLRP